LKLPTAVEATTATLERALVQQRVVERLWQRDASLWHPSAETQAGIARRLGWLDAPARAQLEQVRSLVAATERPALLLAPDDAGGAARLWLDRDAEGVSLLDSWAPATVKQALAASWREILIAADRPSPALDALLAATDGARARADVVVVAPPALLPSLGPCSRRLSAERDAGARFGALGSYGLIAAALGGRDLPAIAGGARTTLEACRDTGGANPALRLGTALAALAQHGYDLLVLRAAPHELPVAEWIAGLLCGALSKHRRGFVPVVISDGQAVQSGRNVARVELRQPGSPAASGWPLIEFRLAGDGDLGALVAVWQLAVAIAAVVIGVNPFDEPDTTALEHRLRQPAPHGLPAELSVTPRAAPDDPADLPIETRWLALVPYFAIDAANAAQLGALRLRLQERTGKPVALIEPLRHGWASQLLHAGRPDGFVLALAPPAGDTPLAALAQARFELDIAAWRRMGRAFVVVDSS